MSAMMPNRLVWFLTRHCLAGMVVGWMVVGGLLGLDVGGLRGLVLALGEGWLPLGLLLAFFGLTFGSLAMGAGIMGLGRDEPPG